MIKRSIVIPIAILTMAGSLFLTIQGCWTRWEGGATEQNTDDAYVRADVTPLSTRISGTVRKVEIGDYQSVLPGQLLVQLDDQDYQAVLEEAKAALAGAEAELASNEAAKHIQETKIKNAETAVAQAAAAVRAAKAGIAAVQPDVERSDSERKRQQHLFAAKAATKQQLEAAIAEADRFRGMLESREADLIRANAALDSSRTAVEAEKRQLGALYTRDGLYQASIRAKQAAIIVANVNLGYTRITAPTAGAVGERHVQEGQLVSAGKQVIDLVKEEVWIQANYKETQLGNIRKGDGADVKIDTFPGLTLHGKVEEIAPASGSQFALLPPDNATGNFTKVVQRVPVKILLSSDNPLKGKLRPGLSATVTIHASGRGSATAGQS